MRMIYMKDKNVGYSCPDIYLKELLELEVFCELPTMRITSTAEVTPQLFDGFVKKFKKVEVVVSDEVKEKEIKKEIKKDSIKKSIKKTVKKTIKKSSKKKED